ncbi:hypothetical protein B0H66DRAFT_602492 [Apodospora peruviana]|uniref:Transcription factor hoxa13 n=1 Tax=Apodospora peruviana TaxID=516989 RepID=A0AAE0IDF6_9PEZI|nr:hypothetical protein B0H66DRAFT_602492 [Apodospora peruviana]
MEDKNGVLKAPKAMNGVNGNIKSALNGHAVGPRKRIVASSGPGLLARSFSIVARLLTWYSIFTILLRCPSNLDACDESSPRICKSYFQLKNTVVPHLEPYYDIYAAPYVELVRPYYNTVDQKVITPGWGYAKKYGAPRVEQVQALGKMQWEKSFQPQIARYQHLVKAQYDQNLAPHVDRVSGAVGPYYDIARTNALQTYHELLLPSYQYVQPYAQQAYQHTSAFTTGTAVPTALWAWNKTYIFLDGTIWPQIRVMYVENVEPQLVKIGQRLGRHSNGKKAVSKAFAEVSSSATKVPSAFLKPSSAISSTTTTSNVAYTTPTTTSVPTQEVLSTVESVRTRSGAEPVSAPEADEALEKEDPVRRTARETVAEDLKDWQERYTKAADEGAAEIEEKVSEITKRMIRRNARVMGKSLLEQLQTTVVSELVTLRRNILQAVGAVAKGNAKQEDGQEEIVTAVRRAGLAIKEKAQDVRTWRENYESEMKAAITKAAETHFSILDNIRDLALQKIGMKWAWMDGVTYKDWAKYHELKGRLDEWKGDLESVIVNHPGLEAAQLEGANIEDEAMKTAASAAKELARLKQVATWKLVSADDTPEFDSTLMQQAAEAAEAAKQAVANVIDKVDDAAEGVKDSVVEQVEAGTDLAKEAISAATSLVSPESSTNDAAGTEATESAKSVVSEELSSVVEPVSEATPSVEEAVEESSAPATEHTPDLASTVVLKETPIFVGNTTEAEVDDPAPVELPTEEEDVEEPEIIATAEASPLSAATVKPAFLGAAAQKVPVRKIILDDDIEDDASNPLESLRDDLMGAYSAALSHANDQYSTALSVVSVQIHGTPKPAHEQMLASVTSAYSNAMASASSRMDDALKAASQLYSGTPTTKNIMPTIPAMPTMPAVSLPSIPTVEWARIESIASERLQQGRAWAEEQYENAKIAAGLATPTPSTPSEHVNKMLENAKFNYYAGLGVAHDRYSEFMAAASSALSSMTATPTPTDLAGSASSAASVASESAASVASVVGENVSSVAAAGYENAASAAAAGYDNVSAAAAAGYDNAASIAAAGYDNAASAAAAGYGNAASVAAAGYDNAASAASAVSDNAAAAADKASESWDAVVAQISLQVYGAPTPTPWYAGVYNAAGDYAASATSAAGEGAASVTSAADTYAAAVSDRAAEQYSSVSSIVSELLHGKEPTFSESVLSRLSAAYVTGVSSASSVASAAQATAASAAADASEAVKSVGEKAASAASEAADAVKEKVDHVRDEL